MSGTARSAAYLFDLFKPVAQGGAVKTAQNVEDLVASVLLESAFSSPSSVSAAGTTQGTATVLTEMFNIVTTVASNTGVKARATYTKIWNAGANDLRVYPITGAQFETYGINAYITVPVGGVVEISMINATQGYAR